MLLDVFHDLLLRIPGLLRRRFLRTEQRVHPVQRRPHAVIRLCAADGVKLGGITCGLRSNSWMMREYVCANISTKRRMCC